MKIVNFLGVIILVILFSCGNFKNHSEIKSNDSDSLKRNDSLNKIKYQKQQDSLKNIEQEKRNKKLFKLKIGKATFKPRFDKRKILIGRFVDSVQIDTLKESYINSLTYKETCNDYEILNFVYDTNSEIQFEENMLVWDTLISMICSAYPRLMLKSNNKNIKTLYLNTLRECSITGITYLINVGDVNSDEKDDIAVLCSHIRYAGVIETCSIYSYKNEKWSCLLKFDVYGPLFYDNDPRRKITDEIPGFLIKKQGKWYYHDYHWGLDSEMRLLKVK